jgi:hypothetical protein
VVWVLELHDLGIHETRAKNLTTVSRHTSRPIMHRAITKPASHSRAHCLIRGAVRLEIARTVSQKFDMEVSQHLSEV